MTVSAMHGAIPEFEDELEGEYEGEEFDLGGVISGLLGEGEFEDELEGEDEYEYELEGEWEDEYEDESERMANPLRRVYPDAMMEHLGHAAAEAETEAEAEAFIGALVPLATGLARAAAPHIARSTPQLVRGLSKVARTLRRNPGTRQLVRALPTVASRTTRSLARQVAHGRPITPHRASRTLARQTAAVLRSPQARRNVVRRARALDRTYHRATRTGQWWKGGTPAGSTTAVSCAGPPAHPGRSRAGQVRDRGQVRDTRRLRSAGQRRNTRRLWSTRPGRNAGRLRSTGPSRDARPACPRAAGARSRLSTSAGLPGGPFHRLGAGSGLAGQPAAAGRLPILTGVRL